MIFKNSEIYFLSASSPIRWAFSSIVLAGVCALWYFFAFMPIVDKIKLIQNKIVDYQTMQQEMNEKQSLAASSQTALSHRLWFAGSYNNFLKDLLASGLTLQEVNRQEIVSHSGSSSMNIKMRLEGTFEKFYEFCKSHHKNYLCQWNSVVCTEKPSSAIAIEADITLYIKNN